MRLCECSHVCVQEQATPEANSLSSFAHCLGALPSWPFYSQWLPRFAPRLLGISCSSCPLVYSLYFRSHSAAWLLNPCLPPTSPFQLPFSRLQSPAAMSLTIPQGHLTSNISEQAHIPFPPKPVSFSDCFFSHTFLYKRTLNSAYTHRIWSEKQIRVIGFNILTFLSTITQDWCI